MSVPAPSVPTQPHNHMHWPRPESGAILLYQEFGEEHQAEHVRAAAASLNCNTVVDRAALFCQRAVPLDTLLDNLSVAEVRHYNNTTQSLYSMMDSKVGE